MATILRNKPYASWFFGAQSPGQYMYAIPRYKYMFYAVFNVNSQALSLYPWLQQIGGIDGISYRIKSVDKPNIELSQKELNQYNRKRFVYTKTEYRPININIYDTVDNNTFDLWKQYFQYYFGDSRNKSSLTMDSSPVGPEFDDSTGWGLRPLGEQVNFFTSLEVYALFGKQYSKVTYLNPKFSNADWGSHDTASSDLLDVKFTVSYETLQYELGDITPALAAQFGFDIGPPAVEPDTGAVGGIDPREFGYYDPLTSQYYGSTSLAESIINISLSAIQNFSLAYASYNALVGTGGGGLYGGQRRYANSLGAVDLVYSSAGIGTDLSYVSLGVNSGITGLPYGQLPNYNTYIPYTDINQFEPLTGYGTYNSLGSYGNFNFGTGQVRSPINSDQYIAQDAFTGETSYRPNGSRDPAYYNAFPARYPGEYGPAYVPGINRSYGLSQYDQIQAARRRVQQGETGIFVSIGVSDQRYTNDGIYDGFTEAPYQPYPVSNFGPSLDSLAGEATSTTGSFGYLDDPTVFGGDLSDNFPPQVVLPIRVY